MSVPVSFFFEDAPSADGTPVKGFAEDGSATYVVDFLNSAEGLQLNRAFMKISDPKVRRKIVDLVKSLSDGPEA
jgi:hypothetical protein